MYRSAFLLVNQEWEEPVQTAKPFNISKRMVWEASKRVQANQGAAGVDAQFDGAQQRGQGVDRPGAFAGHLVTGGGQDPQDGAVAGLAGAAQLLGAGNAPLTVVVKRMPKRGKDMGLGLDGLAQLLTDARGLTFLDDDPAAASQVAAGTFAWDSAPDSWKRSMRELAVVLADDWPRLGLSR